MSCRTLFQHIYKFCFFLLLPNIQQTPQRPLSGTFIGPIESRASLQFCSLLGIRVRAARGKLGLERTQQHKCFLDCCQAIFTKARKAHKLVGSEMKSRISIREKTSKHKLLSLNNLISR
jgi:hypothetical protein